jgi:hypothetical protein
VDYRLPADSLRNAFSTSAIVIIIVMGSTGEAVKPAFW